MSEAASSDPRRLAGVQKAATLLLAMGKPIATLLLKHFSPEELREVTKAAAGLGSVTMQELERLVEEFTADFSAGANLLGDPGKAKALLADAVPPEQMAEILSEALGARAPSVWENMADLPEASLAAFLKDERPLVASFILSQLGSQQAAKVVAQLPREQRNQALYRMMSPPTCTPDALLVVEAALKNQLMGTTPKASGGDNRSKIAEIINGLDPDEAEDVMRMFAEVRPEDAQALKRMLFSFNDMPRLSQRARALLFDKLSSEVVVLALRGVDPEFRDLLLSSMPSRARRLVESELSGPATTPASEIAKARKQITDIVLKMAQRGEIELPTDDSPQAA